MSLQSVPTVPAYLVSSLDAMRAALPVRGQDHNLNALMCNYLAGKGSALVVVFKINLSALFYESVDIVKTATRSRFH